MYDQKLIKIGRMTMLFAIIANFVPAIYVGLRYGEMPSGSILLQLWLLVASAYGISWIVQPIALGIFVCLRWPWPRGSRAWSRAHMRAT